MVRLHYGLISLHYSAVSHIVSLISFYDFASYLIRSLNGIQMNLALWISGCAALASGPPDPQSPVITPGFVRLFVYGDMLLYYKFKMTAKLPLVLPAHTEIPPHNPQILFNK